MVCSPGREHWIVYFAQVRIGDVFASSKEDADYIKLDEISGSRIHDRYGRNGQLQSFEVKELVYVGSINDPRAIY